MSALFARSARLQARQALGGYGRVQRRTAVGVAQDTGKKGDMLQKGAKRDPELYILMAVMSGAFGLAGWFFGRKPTSASSEANVPIAEGSMPWQTEAKGDFKYQYHPGGDRSKPAKDAPSALNVVVVPNVNLPKHLHEKYNKWGKEGY